MKAFLKTHALSLIVAAVFGIVAGLLVWKLKAVVDAAFIISLTVLGFLIIKKNGQDAVDNLTK